MFGFNTRLKSWSHWNQEFILVVLSFQHKKQNKNKQKLFFFPKLDWEILRSLHRKTLWGRLFWLFSQNLFLIGWFQPCLALCTFMLVVKAPLQRVSPLQQCVSYFRNGQDNAGTNYRIRTLCRFFTAEPSFEGFSHFQTQHCAYCDTLSTTPNLKECLDIRELPILNLPGTIVHCHNFFTSICVFFIAILLEMFMRNSRKWHNVSQ